MTFPLTRASSPSKPANQRGKTQSSASRWLNLHLGHERFTAFGGTSGRWQPTWHLKRCNVHRTSGLNHQYFCWNYLIWWMSFPFPSHLSPYCSRLPSSLRLLSCCRHHGNPHLIDHSLELGLDSQSSSESHCCHWNHKTISNRRRSHNILSQSYAKKKG
jgi:hypothetical protein